MRPEPISVDEGTDPLRGRYEYKGKYVPYDRPGYTYKDMDIDGELIDDLSNDMTNDHHSRDGISCRPVSADHRGSSTSTTSNCWARRTYRGREVYRVAFEPKPHQEFDEAAWKGEAMIDAAEYQPVCVHTSAGVQDPARGEDLLGTDIKGLGFSVTYQKFEEGVWFPVSYGGEFEVRAVFFYKRTISVNMVNSGLPPDERQQQRDVSWTEATSDRIRPRYRTGMDFGELMREHRAMVFSVAWHFLHDRDLAEEIAQDVFLSLHKNLARDGIARARRLLAAQGGGAALDRRGAQAEAASAGGAGGCGRAFGRGPIRATRCSAGCCAG